MDVLLSADLVRFTGDACSALPNTWASVLQLLQQHHSLPALLQVQFSSSTYDIPSLPFWKKLFPSLGAVSLDTLLQMFVSQERVSTDVMHSPQKVTTFFSGGRWSFEAKHIWKTSRMSLLSCPGILYLVSIFT